MLCVKNKLCCILCAFCVIFACCGCGLFTEKYACNVDNVESIQIVRLDKYVEGEYRFEYTVLSQISDNETFVSRLNGLEYSVNWGDPRPMYVQYVVIRIEYNNGDFDLLHADAQWFNRSGVNQDGYFFFNDEQFEALVSDYLQ